MTTKIYKFDTGYAGDDFCSKSDFTLYHDQGSVFSEKCQSNFAGSDVNIVQLKRMEGGGAGAPDLINFIFTTLLLYVAIPIAQGFFETLGAEILKGIIASFRSNKGVSSIIIATKEIVILFPPNCSKKDIEGALNEINKLYPVIHNSKKKYVYSKEFGKLIELDRGN